MVLPSLSHTHTHTHSHTLTHTHTLINTHSHRHTRSQMPSKNIFAYKRKCTVHKQRLETNENHFFVIPSSEEDNQ